MYIGYELLQRPVTCDETVSFQFKKSLKILQDNPKTLIAEGHTTQWPIEKGQTTIYKTLHRKLMI